MARTAVTFGILLIGVTVAVIALNGGFKSPTVLIPSIFGLIIAVCGFLAFDEKKRKHAMHGAAAIGLLGAVACLGQGVGQLMRLGTEKAPTMIQLASVWSTAILCVIFVALCVQSFIHARIARQAEAK